MDNKGEVAAAKRKTTPPTLARSTDIGDREAFRRDLRAVLRLEPLDLSSIEP
jgi:hypothetical protein